MLRVLQIVRGRESKRGVADADRWEREYPSLISTARNKQVPARHEIGCHQHRQKDAPRGASIYMTSHIHGGTLARRKRNRKPTRGFLARFLEKYWEKLNLELRNAGKEPFCASGKSLSRRAPSARHRCRNGQKRIFQASSGAASSVRGKQLRADNIISKKRQHPLHH